MAAHEEPAAAQLVTSRRWTRWIGAELTPTDAGHVVLGPMWVQSEAPAEVTRPWPVVLVHGGGGQGTDWLQTADGRPGWASLLVAAGYEVHVVDRPGHGRSPFPPSGLGAMTPPIPFELGRELFAGASNPAHTQWPGDGSEHDEALLQMLCTSGPMRVDVATSQAHEQRLLAALLDELGPSVVVANSLGGPAGFLAADARPELVAALLQVEPFGPPFVDSAELGVRLAWGPTAAPIAYDPPAASPEELGGDAAGRRLTRVAGVPMGYLSAEASMFRGFDEAYVGWLREVGCDVELLRLDDHGVRGNGHAMMHERNHADVLRVALGWLERVEAGAGAVGAGAR